MKLLTLGINHKTAPIALREKASLSPDACAKMLIFFQQSPYCHEAVLVSTCNRTEIYLAVQKYDVETILEVWASFSNLSAKEISEHLYIYHHLESAKHLFKVASGLDSLILGESQILGQLKDAYKLSQKYKMVGEYLNHLFQISFHIAKQIRTQTDIGHLSVSIAYTAVQLSKKMTTDISNATILLVGAGKTIELVAKHLIELNVNHLIIANRTQARANELILELKRNNPNLHSHVIDLGQINEYLPLADIIITSTGAEQPFIFKEPVKQALIKRKKKPMLMIDLAVPRDISEEVANLEDVHLYVVDDLQHIIETNQESRRNSAKIAETMILEKLFEWEEWESLRLQKKLIQSLIEKSEKIRRKSLKTAFKHLKNGKSMEEVFERSSTQLVNKLNHLSLQVIKNAIVTNNRQQLELVQQELDKP